MAAASAATAAATASNGAAITIHMAPPTEVPLELRLIGANAHDAARAGTGTGAPVPVPLQPPLLFPAHAQSHAQSHAQFHSHAHAPVPAAVAASVAAAAAPVAAAPTPAPVPVAVSGTLTQYKTPKNAVLTIVKAGMAKGDLPWHHAFWLAVYAGAYIAMGATLSVVVAGGMTTPAVAGVGFTGTITSAPAASVAANGTAASTSAVALTMAMPPGLVKAMAGAVFPIGLMLVVVCGAELFTGNMMYLSLALYAGKTTWRKAALNLVVVYAGNLIGSLLFAYFFAYLTDTVSSEPYLSYVQKLAVSKVVPHWGRLVLRGVMCNILVAIALWFAIAAEDLPGKLMGVWAPIFLFVACGYEHSVANMFYIPVALMHPWTAAVQPQITTADFIARNLIPVTAGNMIGAAVFVALFYFWVFQPHMALALEAMATAPGVPKHVKRAAAHNKLVAAHHIANPKPKHQ